MMVHLMGFFQYYLKDGKIMVSRTKYLLNMYFQNNELKYWLDEKLECK